MNYIGEYIRKYRGEISLRDFADKCGISHTHLDSIEKGIDPRTGKPVKVTVETLKKIANAMNMTINDLLIKSGDVKTEDLIFDNTEPSKSDTSYNELDNLLFSKAKELNDEEKKAILQVMNAIHKDIDKEIDT